jgi:hypothetical protein
VIVLRLRLPERCKHCGTLGSVRAEQTIKARTVTLRWCCNVCDRGWPVTPDDYQGERRTAMSDRRRVTRNDRRNRRHS